MLAPIAHGHRARGDLGPGDGTTVQPVFRRMDSATSAKFLFEPRGGGDPIFADEDLV